MTPAKSEANAADGARADAARPPARRHPDTAGWHRIIAASGRT
ncbi:hypothetical protein [Duganella callida]|nr:hypothetical protein [Duganella callida]